MCLSHDRTGTKSLRTNMSSSNNRVPTAPVFCPPQTTRTKIKFPIFAVDAYGITSLLFNSLYVYTYIVIFQVIRSYRL